MRGKVAAFDEHQGFGTVEADDGRSFFFHCTAIADRTRTMPVGQTVTFDVVAGHLGRWEATRVERS